MAALAWFRTHAAGRVVDATHAPRCRPSHAFRCFRHPRTSTHKLLSTPNLHTASSPTCPRESASSVPANPQLPSSSSRSSPLSPSLSLRSATQSSTPFNALYPASRAPADPAECRLPPPSTRSSSRTFDDVSPSPLAQLPDASSRLSRHVYVARNVGGTQQSDPHRVPPRGNLRGFPLPLVASRPARHGAVVPIQGQLPSAWSHFCCAATSPAGATQQGQLGSGVVVGCTASPRGKPAAAQPGPDPAHRAPAA